ncbi:MAG: tetratricopeptide repeat protein [Acidobacteriota bacterium]|nr:tetratricopeptide repeat protein [Acidobacteriota bacterium]
MEKISHYCQKCRAANQPGDVVCHRCGTRLMLVVIPPSVRHEETLAPSYYEDHLLERVSLLELRLGQIAERLSMALDLMLRQAKTTQVDHFLLETLIESLNSLGISEKDALTQKLRERLENEDASRETPETRRERIFKNILLNHEQPNADLFAHLVREGIKFLNEGEEKQGFRTLERAAQISPENVPLLVFVAESLYRADKFDAAKKYLEKARELAPQETKILLLSGVIYADEGDAENARKFLSAISNKPETAFCANYAWGFLAAAEEKWMECLAAFNEALKLRDLPEMHYLAACAYFQLESYEAARKHLEKAVEADANFSDAWFMLSVIFNLSGEEAKAGEALERALQAKDAGAECLAFLKRKKDADPRIALPFARLKTTEKHWLTSGARRLTKLFREEIYKIIG